jgi:hypothetical protein
MINVIFDAVSNLGVSLGGLLSTEHPVRRSSPEYLRYFLASCRLLVMSVAVDSNNYRPVTRDEFWTQDPLSMFLLPMEIPYIVLRSASATHVFTDVAYIQFQMSKPASSICLCGCYLLSLCTYMFPVGNNYIESSIRRLDYAKYDFSAVFFETTGLRP